MRYLQIVGAAAALALAGLAGCAGKQDESGSKPTAAQEGAAPPQAGGGQAATAPRTSGELPPPR